MTFRSRILPIVLLVGAAFLLGLTAGPNPRSMRHSGRPLDQVLQSLGVQAASAEDTDVTFAAYAEALDVLKHEYAPTAIDAKKTKELTYAAIEGMLASLNDPFTGFLDQDEWRQMQQTTQGSFEGIGAVLEPVGKDVRVVRPLPGSPATKAGVKAGDTILSVGTHDIKTGKLIKTTPTLGMDISSVVKLIKGPKGTRVTITMLRRGAPKPISFVLTRMHIEPPVVTSKMADPVRKVGHIVLNEFNEKSAVQLDKAVSELQAQGMKGLVFDLRYNPGGLLTAAVEVASRFVSSGPVVLVQEKNGRRAAIRTRRVQRYTGIPIVVLINENSASASEIVAGAIKDTKAGTLVGKHTFGKGLVQTLFPLANDTALRLTTAKYFTPSGRDINNKFDEEHRPIFNTGGIAPDIEVEQSKLWLDQDFEDTKNDTQLARAVAEVHKQMAAGVVSVRP